MTSDPLMKRLRWVMLFVMLLDLLVTLLGQSRSYWTNPKIVNEGDPLVRYFMELGPIPLLLGALAYGVIAMALVSLLPRPIGLTLLLAISFWHFYGACTWLFNTFHIIYGKFLYAFVFAAGFVCLGLGDPQNHYPAARWRRSVKISIGVAVALLALGTSMHLFHIRAHRWAQQDAHAATQRTIDESDVVSRYDPADDTFAILRTTKRPESPPTMREVELREMISSAAPTKRRVFIIYDPGAFPQPVDRETFEERIRSILQSAGATVSFLTTRNG